MKPIIQTEQQSRQVLLEVGCTILPTEDINEFLCSKGKPEIKNLYPKFIAVIDDFLYVGDSYCDAWLEYIDWLGLVNLAMESDPDLAADLIPAPKPELAHIS
jgi:hypothetical protein